MAFLVKKLEQYKIPRIKLEQAKATLFLNVYTLMFNQL